MEIADKGSGLFFSIGARCSRGRRDDLADDGGWEDSARRLVLRRLYRGVAGDMGEDGVCCTEALGGGSDIDGHLRESVDVGTTEVCSTDGVSRFGPAHARPAEVLPGAITGTRPTTFEERDRWGVLAPLLCGRRFESANPIWKYDMVLVE